MLSLHAVGAQHYLEEWISEWIHMKTKYWALYKENAWPGKMT